MKKITLFVAAIAMAASFTSCKKSYHCECSTTVGGTTSTAKGASVEYNKKDADAAKKSCESGSVTSGTVSSSCKWIAE